MHWALLRVRLLADLDPGPGPDPGPLLLDFAARLLVASLPVGLLAGESAVLGHLARTGSHY